MAVIRAILTTIQFRADQLGTPLHISFGGADTGLSSATVLLAGEKKNDEIRRGNNEGRLKKKKKKKTCRYKRDGGGAVFEPGTSACSRPHPCVLLPRWPGGFRLPTLRHPKPKFLAVF